ncbi:MAG: TIR domain-containing protein [Gammaproteobacteria bacterium]|nr:TIR domain-containing protein [Gammaproteobacteria bacterium]
MESKINGLNQSPSEVTTLFLAGQDLVSELSSSTIKVFLSFVNKDKPLVDEFRRELASQYTNLVLLDHAVRDTYDKNWKLDCAAKIDASALLICLIGTTTHRSKPVAWEIDRGLSHGKRVLAFNLVDKQVRLPDVLIRNSITPMSHNAIFAS